MPGPAACRGVLTWSCAVEVRRINPRYSHMIQICLCVLAFLEDHYLEAGGRELQWESTRVSCPDTTVGVLTAAD